MFNFTDVHQLTFSKLSIRSGLTLTRIYAMSIFVKCPLKKMMGENPQHSPNFELNRSLLSDVILQSKGIYKNQN